MARTPEPPKLSHFQVLTPAHNAIWNGALGLWCPFIGVPFVIAQFIRLFTKGSPEDQAMVNFNYLLLEATGWLVAGAIVLSILFSPAFWVLLFYLFRAVIRWLKPNKSYNPDDYEAPSLFWLEFRRALFNGSALWGFLTVTGLLMVGYFIAFELIHGMPIGLAPNDLAETTIINILIGAAIFWVIIALAKAADATAIELSPEIKSHGGLVPAFLAGWRATPEEERKATLFENFVAVPIVAAIGIWIPIELGEHFEGTRLGLVTLGTAALFWVPLIAWIWWDNRRETQQLMEEIEAEDAMRDAERMDEIREKSDYLSTPIKNGQNLSFETLIAAFGASVMFGVIPLGLTIISTQAAKYFGLIAHVPPDSLMLKIAAGGALFGFIFGVIIEQNEAKKKKEASGNTENLQTAKDGVAVEPMPDKKIIEPAPQSIGDPFAFDPSVFKASGSTNPLPKKTPTKARRAPKRKPKSGPTPPQHPEDVELWGVVNDKRSTPEERQTALDMILEREDERKEIQNKS